MKLKDVKKNGVARASVRHKSSWKKTTAKWRWRSWDPVKSVRPSHGGPFCRRDSNDSHNWRPYPMCTQWFHVYIFGWRCDDSVPGWAKRLQPANPLRPHAMNTWIYSEYFWIFWRFQHDMISTDFWPDLKSETNIWKITIKGISKTSSRNHGWVDSSAMFSWQMTYSAMNLQWTNSFLVVISCCTSIC